MGGILRKALALVFVVAAMAGGARAEDKADTASIGIFLVSLHALDVPGETFGADFWVWENHRSPRLEPLKSMELVGSKSAAISLQSTQDNNGHVWSQQKVQGLFRHNWDMRNFPFDRHTLSIVLEEAQDDVATLVYTPDLKGSGHNKDIKIDGFTISDVAVRADQRTYESNFGDVSAPEISSYSRVRMDIELQRDSLVLFLKLHIALYAAFLVSATAFALLPFIPSMMNTVNSIIVGTLFASIINLRAVDSVVGRSETVTLVDRLHFLTFMYFVALGGISMWVFVRRKQWDDAALTRFSKRAGIAYVGTYLVSNAFLIWMAAGH